MTTAFQAYAAGGFSITAPTPRQAALAFFERFPSKRKCNIIEGVVDGHFFVVSYGSRSNGHWPKSFKDVTKKTAATIED